ncbi:MAG: DUF3137 domain-containing protein [Chloroflexaceae bacterium]|jgi:hypothetical protein|nr:DUF3137 domain-containing protein [Chloroflexaceae bacterium]
MGVLRQLFGASKDEIWQQLANEIGGTLVRGDFPHDIKVEAHVGEWTLTLDSYVVSTGQITIIYTRMRAPYVNKDGLRFKVYRKGLFSDLGKLLGMQDIQTGDQSFDDAFIIKGNDEAQVRRLLHNPRLRRLIDAQPEISLSVEDDDGWFGKHFPEGVDELRFLAHGTITDLTRLKALYDLFAEVLHSLCQIGSAYEEDPHVQL